MAEILILSSRGQHSPQYGALAKPGGNPDGNAAVQIYFNGEKTHISQVLTMDEAERLFEQLGTAIGAIRLGKAYSAGSDPRDVERLYRARLAIRLGLDAKDVRTVFDLDPETHARLEREVRG